MTRHLLTTTDNGCMLLKIENVIIKSQCPQNWIRFHKPEISLMLRFMHCTVPDGCAVSFSSVPFFLLGGRREEWPTNSGKQKTLTHR